MLSRGLVVAASLAFTLIPGVVAAQSFLNTEPYSVSVNPDFPAPFSQAVLTPYTGSVNLANASMTVKVDTKVIYQGNPRSFSVPLGAAGKAIRVDIVVTSNGQAYPKTITLRPQEVTLVVEPVSSAPPLYPGKPLIPLDGSVRVVAIAGLKNAAGVALDPSTLSYSWTVDATRIAASSGIGKDTILVASPLQYRSLDVSVVVQNQDGSLVGGGKVSLSPEEPTVRLYEQDPLLGVLFERALAGSFSIGDSEKTIYGFGYSLPLKGSASSQRWFLNGSAAQNGPAITIRPAGSGSGTASLSFVASAGELVTANEKLSVTFGATRGGFGIFGL